MTSRPTVPLIRIAKGSADGCELKDAVAIKENSMVNIAGDIASSIDGGLIAAQKQHLLTIAHYALAWLAELVEKEEA